MIAVIMLSGYGSSSVEGFPIVYCYLAMGAGFLVYLVGALVYWVREEIQERRDEETLRELDRLESDRRG